MECKICDSKLIDYDLASYDTSGFTLTCPNCDSYSIIVRNKATMEVECEQVHFGNAILTYFNFIEEAKIGLFTGTSLLEKRIKKFKLKKLTPEIAKELLEELKVLAIFS